MANSSHSDVTLALIRAEEEFLLNSGWTKHPTNPKLWTPRTTVGLHTHGGGFSRSSAVSITKQVIDFPSF